MVTMTFHTISRIADSVSTMFMIFYTISRIVDPVVTILMTFHTISRITGTVVTNQTLSHRNVPICSWYVQLFLIIHNIYITLLLSLYCHWVFNWMNPHQGVGNKPDLIIEHITNKGWLKQSTPFWIYHLTWHHIAILQWAPLVYQFHAKVVCCRLSLYAMLSPQCMGWCMFILSLYAMLSPQCMGWGMFILSQCMGWCMFCSVSSWLICDLWQLFIDNASLHSCMPRMATYAVICVFFLSFLWMFFVWEWVRHMVILRTGFPHLCQDEIHTVSCIFTTFPINFAWEISFVMNNYKYPTFGPKHIFVRINFSLHFPDFWPISQSDITIQFVTLQN